MTSPGGWFGGFLDDTVGKVPPTSPGSSVPQAPSNRTAPRVPGSADSLERQADQNRYAPPQPASKYGQILYSGLDLPDEWAATPFTMGVQTSPVTDGLGNPATRTDLVQMTVAAGLEWFRNLAVTSKEQYNSWVVKLYDAGYLTENELRFNAYTSVVAQAFVEAAHDTASVNASDSAGRVVTLGDNLDNLAAGAQEMGGDGSGGSGATPRVDQTLDETTLKDSIRSTSRNLLGRALSDDEEADLVGRFRTAESAWNDATWNARVNGGTTTTAPDPDAISKDQIDNGELGAERAAQQLGGYAGVLMNMVGLGHSTSIGGTLA